LEVDPFKISLIYMMEIIAKNCP